MENPLESYESQQEQLYLRYYTYQFYKMINRGLEQQILTSIQADFLEELVNEVEQVELPMATCFYQDLDEYQYQQVQNLSIGEIIKLEGLNSMDLNPEGFFYAIRLCFPQGAHVATILYDYFGNAEDQYLSRPDLKMQYMGVQDHYLTFNVLNAYEHYQYQGQIDQTFDWKFLEFYRQYINNPLFPQLVFDWPAFYSMVLEDPKALEEFDHHPESMALHEFVEMLSLMLHRHDKRYPIGPDNNDPLFPEMIPGQPYEVYDFELPDLESWISELNFREN